MGYTYVGYPLLLRVLARGKTLDTLQFGPGDAWPRVSVLMAVHNEARVIRQKMDSLLGQDYPPELLAYYIGSDCSTDETNAIVAGYAATDPRIQFRAFTQRQGKPGIINQLAALAAARYPAGQDHIFIITDASVMLQPEVVSRLAAHFKTPDMAIVDALIVHTGMQSQGISRSEDAYISGEGRIKYREGVVWKRMIGPFGGCYALRSDYFCPVPATFLVDDFYITMRAFERGGLAISEPAARCLEPVGHEISEEFRRKARISAGNFQNMYTFRKLWWPPRGLPNFPFFSHKILRWLGPFWLLGGGLSGAYLAAFNLFYACAFGFMAAVLLLPPLADAGLRKFGIHCLPLRHIRYFLLMNLALFVGFIRYQKGIRTNVWQPPKRQ
jgi:cellulose synthase/poly-beta-1,6-N-acetylglucosamine synthase-like glycosyltransferase